MSSSLANTVTLLGAAGFRERVKAAMIEHAVSVVGETTGSLAVRAPRVALAKSIVYDADTFVPTFARLVANDSTVSTYIDPAAVDEADYRRVVSDLWSSIAASVPNLPRS